MEVEERLLEIIKNEIDTLNIEPKDQVFKSLKLITTRVLKEGRIDDTELRILIRELGNLVEEEVNL